MTMKITPAKAAKAALIAAGTLVGMALILSAADNFMRYRDTAAARKGGSGVDPRNATYRIEGEAFALVNGNAANEADGVRTAASIFGIPTEGDLDGDGDRDAVVLLTVDRGGSGSFYYLAAAIKGDAGYVGSDAVLVGDRIAPDTTSIENGMIVHNYATRYPWEPFTAQTSVGKTKRLRYVNGALAEAQTERLTDEVARELAAKTWGDCHDADCDAFTVDVLDGVDGVWYVQATWDGFMDDSIKAERKIAAAHHTGSGWVLGATLAETQQCREGRGHQDFSAELCI